MLEAVVFDLDGTLIDSTEAIIESFFHTFETVDIESPSRQAVYDSISMPLEKQFALFTDRDPVELSRVYREHYFETSPLNTTMLPGVGETLVRLQSQGLRMAIATSKSHRGSEILLDHLQIADYFEFIVGADCVSHHKPHLETLELSMSRMKIDPDQMIYVADTRYDTEASKRAGVDCIAVSTGYADRSLLTLYTLRIQCLKHVITLFVVIPVEGYFVDRFTVQPVESNVDGSYLVHGIN